ncbi:hypothetical protein Hanom_Chr09g00782321 [Helianthus anomalus]
MRIFRLKILLLFVVKVGIPWFLNGIGNGVETHAESLKLNLEICRICWLLDL